MSNKLIQRREMMKEIFSDVFDKVQRNEMQIKFSGFVMKDDALSSSINSWLQKHRITETLWRGTAYYRWYR